MQPTTYDIAILGSGFAGSLCALILDRLGRSVVVIDKAQHPRFAIGESSTPIGNMVLRDLARRYDLPFLMPLVTYGTWRDTYPQLGVGRKRGFSYFLHRPDRPFQPDDAHSTELLVAANRDDYRCDTHWLRADIDHFFIEHVRAAGIPVYENTTIQRLRHENGWEIEALHRDESVHLRASFAIDATGPASLLAHYLKLPDRTSALLTHSRALYSHFDGLPRWQDLLVDLGARTADYPFACDDAALHHIIEGGWMWMLRFADNRTSAGNVLDASKLPPSSVPPEAEWTSHLERYPSLARLFRTASLSPAPGQIVRTGRLQRLWDIAAGPDWALLPHAAGFIDPLHSTGIAHALCGIEHLTGILDAHWDKSKLEAALAAYSARLISELRLIDVLVAGCYASFGDFRLMAAFLMLYFAAAITYEEGRSAAYAAGVPFDRWFLGAEDARFIDIVRQIYQELKQLTASQFTLDQVTAFEQRVAQRIAPYNTAGLFAPRITNMYEYTAIDTG